MIKICKVCGEDNPDNFYKGQKNRCKECDKEKSRKRHRASRDSKEGHIYCITNPAYPEWVKVGLTTTDIEKRLMSYNTGSPHRDYVVDFLIESPIDIYDFELEVHKEIDDHAFETKNEWFRIELNEAITIIKQLIKKYP